MLCPLLHIQPAAPAGDDAASTPVDVLLRELRARDPEIVHHLRRVQHLSIAIGVELRLPEAELQVTASPAGLHDVGLLACPDHAAGFLGPSDPAGPLFRARVGPALLASLPGLQRVADIVLACDERFDGTGAPRGLAGACIPIGARIIAVANAVDELSAAPPDPRHLGRSIADRIARRAGTDLDPSVVAAWCGAASRRLPLAAQMSFA